MVGPAFCLTSGEIKPVAVSWLKVCALIPVNDTQVQVQLWRGCKAVSNSVSVCFVIHIAKKFFAFSTGDLV